MALRKDKLAEGCAAALAALPQMGPRRLQVIVRAWGFVDAWEKVCRGEWAKNKRIVAKMGQKPEELARLWAKASKGVDPERLYRAHEAAGIQIILFGSDNYPSVLAADIDPPMALFVRGDLAHLAGPRVAIVGTRRATTGGRQTASEIGELLLDAGIGVVSGLALGIDGAAHAGAFRAKSLKADGPARVIGVVATGLDVVYPTRHQNLWSAIATRGLLLSEWPMGVNGTRWRFPARNRLIAALSDIVVVVESHVRGGALLTVDEAIARDRHVMVVPGSVRNPAAEGTNNLLVDGLAPLCRAEDVLSALDLSACSRSGDPLVEVEQLPFLEDGDTELLGRIGWEPVALDVLAAGCGLPLGELSVRLVRLEASGDVARFGSTIERIR